MSHRPSSQAERARLELGLRRPTYVRGRVVLRPRQRIGRGYLFACAHGGYEAVRRSFAKALMEGVPLGEARRAVRGLAEVPLPDLPGMWLTRDQGVVLQDLLNAAAERVIVGQAACPLYSRSYGAERTGLSQRRVWDALRSLQDKNLIQKSDALTTTTSCFIPNDDLLDALYEELSVPPTQTERQRS